MTTKWDLTLNVKSTDQILFFEIVNNTSIHCHQMFQHCRRTSCVLNLWCRKSHRGVKKTAAHRGLVKCQGAFSAHSIPTL